MDVSRSCTGELNWGSLREFPGYVASKLDGQEVEDTTIQLDRLPDSVMFDSFDEGCNDVRGKGQPDSYGIRLALVFESGLPATSISIHRYSGGRIDIDVRHCPDLAFVDGITDFLALRPKQPPDPKEEPPTPERTVFIAHRFDDVGDVVAGKAARLFELVNFKVASGRGYSPRPISDKVRSRIEQQALTVAIFTPGDDETWLVQESILAEIKDKPLIIVRDKAVSSKPGLLADYEYIPFEAPHIETTFIQILEGLVELGYSFQP